MTFHLIRITYRTIYIFADWSTSGLEHRYGVLMAIGDELIARKDELGELLSREEGKPLAEGRGEVYRSGQFFHYYAAEVLRQIDERTESVRPGVEVDTRREPLGVVGIISLWNFPMATAVWKIAPALAFGNAVVFKPANLVPASAWELTKIISKQDLPAGTFNLVMGSGGEVGETLINSPDIQAVSFTGSLEGETPCSQLMDCSTPTGPGRFLSRCTPGVSRRCMLLWCITKIPGEPCLASVTGTADLRSTAT